MRLRRVGDRAVERLPAGAEPERRHHQPRVAEHLLGLHEALTLDAADQPIGGHVDLVEEQRRGVAEPDAVLVLVVAVGEALGALLDDEPARPAGGEREHGVEIGHAAVGDPLLDAADAVAAVLGDGDRLERAEVAAGLGLGRAVGEQHAVLRDPGHVLALLLRRAADADRIAAELRRELRGREAEVERGHPLADAIDVERAAAHAAVLERHEDQLEPELVARGHPAHERLWELVALVELDQQRIGKLARGEVVDRLQRDLQHFGVELVGHVHMPPRYLFTWTVRHRGLVYIGHLSP